MNAEKRTYNRQYYLLNRDTLLAKQKLRGKQSYLAHREKILKRTSEYRLQHPEKQRLYARRFRESAKGRIYLLQLNSRIETRIRKSVSASVSAALKRNKFFKNASITKLIGCDIPHLKSHLELQFRSGMNWSNYGFSGWHIDHITPCASFDLSLEDERMRCFHYANLRPLWAHENLTKNDKLPDGTLARRRK